MKNTIKNIAYYAAGATAAVVLFKLCQYAIIVGDVLHTAITGV